MSARSLAAVKLASPTPSAITSSGTTYRFVGFLVVCPSISQRPSNPLSPIKHTFRIKARRSRVYGDVSRKAPSMCFHGRTTLPHQPDVTTRTRLHRATSTSTFNQRGPANGSRMARYCGSRGDACLASAGGRLAHANEQRVHLAFMQRYPAAIYHSTRWALPLCDAGW